MKFEINGELKEYQGDSNLSLLKYLRKSSIKSVKEGCSGEGTCGACAVLVDGKTVLSCRTTLSKIENKKIQTTEGFLDFEKKAFSEAFVRCGGVQCGFCTPGIVIRAKELLEKNPSPTREEIKNNIKNHICRCTGYVKIIDSIYLAAQFLREKKIPPLEEKDQKGNIGTSYPKYKAYELVLGFRPFVCDLEVPSMLHGVLYFSKYPKAKILKIETSKAKMNSHVVKILTAEDILGEPKIGLIHQDWPVFVGVGETTGYIGDVLACVVATSEEEARKALDLIEVEYEVLEPLTDMHEAFKQKSILSTSHIKYGNTAEAFQNCAYQAEGTFHTPRIEHAFLEPECCLAYPLFEKGEKKLQVYSQSQGVYEDLKQICRLLNVKKESINVIQVPCGGGFGGKEDLTIQGHTSLASWILEQPVRIALTRQESMRMHSKRHPFEIQLKIGCDEKGILQAIEATMYADSGIYASVGMKVIERAVSHSTGAYTFPHVNVQGFALITNNVPCGAMRGFGVNQGAFALETLIDELCEKGGFDRWQFRWNNALREGTPTASGQIMQKGVGVRACLEAIKPAYLKGKYVGLAAGIKNTGIGCGMPDIGNAKIEIQKEKIILHHGWTEMGQGLQTMAVQAFVEATGLSPHLVEVKVETQEETPCGMTTSSRGTSLLAHSIKEACESLNEDLKTKSIQDLIGKVYTGTWIYDKTTKIGKTTENEEIISHYSYGYAAQVVELNEQGKIKKITAAHDAGKIYNPTLFEGQIEGALHMGLGFTLSEEYPYEKGYPTLSHFGKLGIIKAHKMPELEIIGVEVFDPNGPWGAKGVGEIGLVPTAPAITNALYQFDKKRRYRLPIKEDVLE